MQCRWTSCDENNMATFTAFTSSALCLLLIGYLTGVNAGIATLNCSTRTYIYYESSGTIQSPCYPGSYTICPSVTSANCSTIIYALPLPCWIGLYINAGSTDYNRDNLTINNQLGPYRNSRSSYAINSIRHKDNGGFFHQYFKEADGISDIFIDFRKNIPLNIGDSRFILNYKVAYVVGREDPIDANNEGFIVSHKNFDYGDTYYDADGDNQIRLTGIRGTLRINFLYFRVHHWPLFRSCFDFLEIITSRETKSKICGWQISDGEHIDAYPIDETVTIRFVTARAHHQISTEEAGFLIKYEVIRSDMCPPDNIQNADLTAIGGTEWHTVTCNPGYRMLNSSAVKQTIICSANNNKWTNKDEFRPCVADTPTETLSEDDRSTHLYIGIGVGGAVVVVLVIVMTAMIVKWRRSSENKRHNETGTASAPQTTESAADYTIADNVGQPEHVYSSLMLEDYENVSVAQRRQIKTGTASAPQTADAAGEYMTADNAGQPEHIYSRPMSEDYENSSVDQRAEEERNFPDIY